MFFFQMVGVGTKHVNLDGYKNIFCSMLGQNNDSWGLSYQVCNIEIIHTILLGENSCIFMKEHKLHLPISLVIRGLQSTCD